MKFETINTITEDLLRIIRSSNIVASEDISRRQVENWVHQYRGVLLERSLNDKATPNPDYMQTIHVPLELASNFGDFGLDVNVDTLAVTTIDVPKAINLRKCSGIRFIGVDGKEIPLYPQFRTDWQYHRRYTGTAPYAFLLDNKLYIMNAAALNSNLSIPDSVKIIGVFEDPMEAYEIADPDVTLDRPYPVPNNKVPALKGMILEQELGVMVAASSDKENNSNNDLN